jgi:protein TonB
MSFFGEQDGAEWITLADPRPPRRRRWFTSLSSSTIIHAALVAAIAWPLAPIFVSPRLVARGEGGNAAGAMTVDLYVPKDLQAVTQSRSSSAVTLPAPKPEKAQESKLQKRTNALEVKQPTGEREIGSPDGNSNVGLAWGDEVKPALPSYFPDFRLKRDELPDGVQGDVIVEVTIDTQGSVTEEKLLQGIGHGVDERVIAVVHDWRFRPATRNGVPILSKHDVHFHFPS